MATLHVNIPNHETDELKWRPHAKAEFGEAIGQGSVQVNGTKVDGTAFSETVQPGGADDAVNKVASGLDFREYIKDDTQLTLTATPNAGYKFKGWYLFSLGIIDYLLEVGDRTHVHPNYTLSRVVTENPLTRTVDEGMVTTASNSVDITPTHIGVDEDDYMIIQAIFEQDTPQYTITIGGNAGGAVETDASGSAVSNGTSDITYTQGETAVITATPQNSHRFVKWVSGSDASGTQITTNKTFSHTVTMNNSFYAVFEEKIIIDGTVELGIIEWIGSDSTFTYTDTNPSHPSTFRVGSNSDVEIKDTLRGIGSSGPQSSNSSWGRLSGFGEYDGSSTITYSYSNLPAGYEFLGWFGKDSFSLTTYNNDTNPSQLSRTFNPNNASDVGRWDSGAPSGQDWNVQHYAVIREIPSITYNLQVSASTGGSVSGATSGSYEEGTSLTLTAAPSSGYQFLNWTNTAGVFQSAVNPLAITMNSSKEYTAVFQLSNTTSFSVGETVWHNGVQKQIDSISGSIITFTDGSSAGAAGVSSSPPNNTIFVVGQLVWHNGVHKVIESINGTVITFTDGSVSGHSSVSENEPLPAQGAVSIRNDVGRHIYDLGTKEIPAAHDLFLLSTIESDNSKSARRVKFKDMSKALMSDMGQSKDGISTGGFLTQNYPQLIGGPKTFLSDDFLKIQRTNGTLGNLVNGEVYSIWEYVNAAVSGDDLGNHVATQNLKMGNYFITHSGGTKQGIKLGNDGSVGIGFDGVFNWNPTSEYPFTVKGAKARKGYLVGFAQQSSGENTLRLTGATETTSNNFIDGDIDGSLKFAINYKGGADFKDSLAVQKAITGGGGKFSLSAGGDLTLTGSTTTQALTVKNAATFSSSTSFSAATVFSGTTQFSNTATFNKAATFKESATFTKSTVFNESPVFNKNITLASGATIIDSNGNSAGVNPGQGLERDADGNIKINLGVSPSTSFALDFINNLPNRHCGLEFDDDNGLRLSTKETTAATAHFHAVVCHPTPQSNVNATFGVEGGQVTLKKPGSATSSGDYIIDSYRDTDNGYWTISPSELNSDNGYNAATANAASKELGRDVLRIGHEHSKVLGLYIGEKMLVTNQHMRIADGNGHACLYAGSGKHGSLDTANPPGSSTDGHFVFRTTKDVNDLSKGYTEMAAIKKTGVYALSVKLTSDRRLKKDIKKLNSAELLKKALKLKPSSFKNKIQNEENKTSLGFIAQEVEKIIPEAVSTREEEIETRGLENTLSISYEQIIPVLCGAIQEQQKQIEELKKDIKKLKG